MQSFVLDVFRQLDCEVETRWQQLEALGACTAFQTLGWLKPWYEIFAAGPDAKPLIVFVRDQTTNHDMLMLPLCLVKQGIRRTVMFADRGVSDYNAPVLGAEDISPLKMRRLWQELIELFPGIDEVLLEKMPMEIAGRTNPLAALDGLEAMPFAAHTAHMTDCFETFERTRLSRNMRAKLRRVTNKAMRQGNLNLTTANDPAAAQVILETLIQQRQKRARDAKHSDVFAAPLRAAFYRRLVSEGLHGGPCKIIALTIDDCQIAALLGVVHDETFHMLIPAFSGDAWSAYSPGHLLFYRHMKELHGQGIRAYDFTIGDEPYKAAYGTTAQPLFSYAQCLSFNGYLTAAHRAVRRWGRAGVNASKPVVMSLRRIKSRFTPQQFIFAFILIELVEVLEF